MNASKLLILLLMTIGVACHDNSSQCNTPADVVFLLDGSESISQHKWKRVLSFVDNIVNNLDIRLEDIHVGVVSFSSSIGHIINLIPPLSKKTLKLYLKRLGQVKGKTNTKKGIEKMRDIFTYQGRQGVSRFAVLITDGISPNPQENIKEAAAAKKEGITMVTVGVGHLVNLEELQQIASSQQDFFAAAKYEALPEIATAVRDVICRNETVKQK